MKVSSQTEPDSFLFLCTFKRKNGKKGRNRRLKICAMAFNGNEKIVTLNFKLRGRPTMTSKGGGGQVQI